MSLTKQKQFLIYGNILSFLLTIVMNSLANILPLNGKTTAELSDSFPNLFVPAGYVFSIWGLIYILLAIFTVSQALPKYREEDVIEKISYFFIISNLANSSWIVFWHFEIIIASLLVMLILLVSLILIYTRLEIGKKPVSEKIKITSHIPFSVYLGWITVATVANVTALLVSINWDGFGISEVIWTAVVISVATIIALVIVFTRKDYAYVLVPVWAFIGIAVKQLNTQNDVVIISVIAAVILVITLLVRLSLDLVQNRK
ncbi:MAG: tryptophan-rich sensory protein [Promethearchaeota archaeon]